MLLRSLKMSTKITRWDQKLLFIFFANVIICSIFPMDFEFLLVGDYSLCYCFDIIYKCFHANDIGALSV